MNIFNTTERGYRYNKFIFFSVFLITLGLVFYLFYLHNFDFTPSAYLKCDYDECKNPLYGQPCKQRLKILFFIPLYTTGDCSEDPAYNWVSEPYIPRGEYGEPPPEDFLYKHIKLIVALLFILTFVLNHFLHNRGKKFDLEIRITDKLRINRDFLRRKLKENEGKKE